ncbi:MAG TPA: hypothetical protein VKV40_17365 [Ktedonobacteraceae bacterium]|nr:hypothetical protein [Ktedonobacteraceae bacterium]
MNGAAIVKQFIIALESQEYTLASAYLADDCTFTSNLPRPLDKKQFIALMKELKYGLPNLSLNASDIHETNNELEQEQSVECTVQLTGTQSNIMELVPLSLPPISETNRLVRLPVEHWHFTIINDQITAIVVPPVPGGGIPGLLAQLGVNIPIIQ